MQKKFENILPWVKTANQLYATAHVAGNSGMASQVWILKDKSLDLQH